ncbi:TIGR03013 family XrtA/PEP-CTERM system glycosyltransferase [Nitrospira moscoviensis]|uniref:Putative Undecaprenyl-phosphate galactose phosphotransferase RfbP n=1 Tax=Nitrospira moscoviensis TaxID=42253 RepID=A0A0K2GG21_NITMO|nr:TIGR03013 family XrtA/PEP-CTERM system glycosyltransferase [Nitrospira moscoviensis]ALA59804.1 putative Undecaprenyl-phosphate galactose phosphotransferase RfbP [Nitrospira moscoviensis]
MRLPTIPGGEGLVTGVEVEARQVETGTFFPIPFSRRLLILGNGQLACQLFAVLKAKRTSRVHVIGYVDREPSTTSQCLATHLFLGPIGQLFEIVERYQIHTIAVCLEDRRATLPVQTLLDFKAMGLEVVDGHHLYEEEAGRLSIDSLRPSALVFSTGFKRRALTTFAKRLFDVVVSAVSLVLLSPLFVLIGLLVKLDSPGPVFYCQMRVGLRGQPYMIWKFRSMTKDAEKGGPRWAQAQDPRVSRVGWWLRKTRLDELPQFINVLKGEMSLVGPRPERPVFVQELRAKIPYYDIRHTVRPGITGWAQTQFRYGASAEDSHTKLQYDLYYVKNMTFALDARILVETIRVVLLGEGAR